MKEAGSSEVMAMKDQPSIVDGSEREQMDEHARADQLRLELLDALDETHQERLQTLADVFKKAQLPDLPTEVWCKRIDTELRSKLVLNSI